MLLQQIEQDRAGLAAIAFQAINTGEVQIGLVESGCNADTFLKLGDGIVATARAQIQNPEIIQGLGIIGAQFQSIFADTRKRDPYRRFGRRPWLGCNWPRPPGDARRRPAAKLRARRPSASAGDRHCPDFRARSNNRGSRAALLENIRWRRPFVLREWPEARGCSRRWGRCRDNWR